jgi:hypothetical protein
MFPKTVFVAILVLALVSMACGITINVPSDEITVGPTQTMTINIPAPSSAVADVTLDFGAGELGLAPGATDALVEGTAYYNVAKLKPEITVTGGRVRISTGKFEIKGFPSIHVEDLKNEWDLKLGTQPMRLEINAGAYQGRFELGGLALQNLEVNDGAADVQLEFSQPNKVPMDRLIYSSGASNVKLSGLANANFEDMVFRGGMGEYVLDFSGQLQRDAAVTVESGMSQVTISVPEGVPATVSFTGGLANITMEDDWQKSGNTYTHAGSGPKLTITVTMGAGEVELIHSR